MHRLIPVPTPAGAAENAAIIIPLEGPFVTLWQHETFDKEMSWDAFLSLYEDKKSFKFNLKYGCAVYQNDGFGKITLAGYHYDTSN